MDVQTTEGHAVDAVGIVLVARAGVLGERAGERLEPVRAEEAFQLRAQFLRDGHCERFPSGSFSESACRLRMGVSVRDIRLDVVDGRPVHKVGAKYMYDRSVFAFEVDAFYAYA